MEKKHKKCPHCAHDEQSMFITQSDGFGFGAIKYYSVICDKCRATGPERSTPEDAWKAWDTRMRKSSSKSRFKIFD